MKSIGLSFVMAALLLAGCQKRVVSNEESDAPALVNAPPPTPDYAPPGVFFLLTPVRKETKDGIVRLLPGTEVKLLKNGKYQTPEGEMALDARVLTNDRTAARAAHNLDARGQVASRPQALPPAAVASTPAAAPQKASATASQLLAAILPATKPAATNPTPANPAPTNIGATGPAAGNPPPPPTNSSFPDDEKTRALKFRLASLKGEEAKLQANVTFLWEKAVKPPPSMRTQNAPTGLGGSSSLGDWDALNARLLAVRAEIRELEAKLQGTPAN